MATAAEIQTAYKAIYRADLNVTVATAIANTGISVDAYIAQQLPQVASTTQAAVAIASFVTGTAPTSDKLDALKVEADKQVASYTALGVGNPSLGAYEAFGRSFATDATTTAGFNTKYGALSTADFITLVYAQVYGTTPSAGAAANLTAQITYFTNLYTANNIPNAALAAKGAVLGQIVGYAFTSTASANSTLDNQVQSLLTSAAKGDTTVYNKALPTVTDPGAAGVSISGIAAGTVVSPTAADPAFKTTAGNDTITGTVDSTTKVDGGAGDDVLTVTYNDATGAAAGAIKPTLTGVETVNVTAITTADGQFDVDGAVGLKTVGFVATNPAGVAGEIINIATGVALSVADTDGTANTTKNSTFTFKDVTGTNDSATLTVNGLDTAASVIKVAGVENLTLNAVTANSTFTLDDAALKTLTISAAKNLTVDLTAEVALTTVTASGAGAVTLNNLQASVTSVDASASTGVVTFAAAAGLQTIKTGSGADVITAVSKAGANADLGAGNDQITFTLAGTDAATVKGGLGGDTITTGNNTTKVTAVYTSQAESTNANFDTFTNFNSGSDKLDFKALALAGDKTALNTFNAAAALADGTDYFAGKAVAFGNFAGGDYFVLADINNNGKFDVNSDLIIKVGAIANTVVIGDFIFS
jgi:hypothetical protein